MTPLTSGQREGLIAALSEQRAVADEMCVEIDASRAAITANDVRAFELSERRRSALGARLHALTATEERLRVALAGQGAAPTLRSIALAEGGGVAQAVAAAEGSLTALWTALREQKVIIGTVLPRTAELIAFFEHVEPRLVRGQRRRISVAS